MDTLFRISFLDVNGDELFCKEHYDYSKESADKYARMVLATTDNAYNYEIY